MNPGSTPPPRDAALRPHHPFTRRDCLEGAWRLAIIAAALPLRPARAGDAVVRSFALHIRQGRVPADKRTIRVKAGDTVELRWSADRPVELHLHGYDIMVRVRPGEPRNMTVKAHTAGRFPIEIHGKGRHGNVVYLEVYPR